MPSEIAAIRDRLATVRSALFLPASNARAIDKARTLACHMVLIDLEDAVRPAEKGTARIAAVQAAQAGFGGRPFAIRINGFDAIEHAEDTAAVAGSAAPFVVLPKVADAHMIDLLNPAIEQPLLAMIECPAGVLAARTIAAHPRVAGLIAGNNDLAATLGTRGRAGLATALQTMVLAARASGKPVFDGVFNVLDDAAGLAAECAEARDWGFTGKTLIHPGQIDAANAAFAPDPAALAEARALVAAATGGAERFAGRMIEDMHVAAARALVAAADREGTA